MDLEPDQHAMTLRSRVLDWAGRLVCLALLLTLIVVLAGWLMKRPVSRSYGKTRRRYILL